MSKAKRKNVDNISKEVYKNCIKGPLSISHEYVQYGHRDRHIEGHAEICLEQIRRTYNKMWTVSFSVGLKFQVI